MYLTRIKKLKTEQIDKLVKEAMLRLHERTIIRQQRSLEIIVEESSTKSNIQVF